MPLQRRRLGRTGFHASIVALGGCGVGRKEASHEEIGRALELALRYGVNVVDVAPTYGEAETNLASWVQKHRNTLFLAEKTRERSRKGASTEMQRSLETLGVRSFDLYQLHGVGDLEQLDIALGKDGALEALKEAQETGLIRYIGITGHKDMTVLLKAIERFDFDSVLLPVNLAGMINPKPENDFRPVLKKAAEREMAVIAIKAIAKSRWKTGEKHYTTWYKPVETMEQMEQAVWFTLSQPSVVTYSLPCDVRLWPMVLKVAERFKQLDENEQRQAVEQSAKADFRPLFPTNVGEFLPEQTD